MLPQLFPWHGPFRGPRARVAKEPGKRMQETVGLNQEALGGTYKEEFGKDFCVEALTLGESSVTRKTDTRGHK